MGVTECLSRFTSAFDKGVHSRLPSSTTLSTGFLAKPCKIIHVSKLVFGDDIVLLSNSYREMQGPLKTVNQYSVVNSA